MDDILSVLISFFIEQLVELDKVVVGECTGVK